MKHLIATLREILIQIAFVLVCIPAVISIFLACWLALVVFVCVVLMTWLMDQRASKKFWV